MKSPLKFDKKKEMDNAFKVHLTSDHDWWFTNPAYRYRIYDVNKIYPKDYYQPLYHENQGAYDRLASYILKNVPFRPEIVYDFGACCGWLVKSFRDTMIHATGIEASKYGIEYGVQNCIVNEDWMIEHDLREPVPLFHDKEKCLITCTEVAEHIEIPFSSQLIRNITENCTECYFTFCPPIEGRAAINHPNEMPKDFWINLFAYFDFKIYKDLTDIPGFRRNGIIFVRSDKLE